MGLDRPIKLFLIFAFASVSNAAIRHLWRISAILLGRPSGSKLGRSEFSSSKCPGTQRIRPNTHSARQALSGSHFATHQCPQQFCIPFVANTWHCFPPVPFASVLQPVLVPQICLVLLPCRRTPLRSETCVDQLEDILGFQPISTNLSRKLSRWSRQIDQQSGSQLCIPDAASTIFSTFSVIFKRGDSSKVIFQKFTSMDTMSLKVSA